MSNIATEQSGLSIGSETLQIHTPTTCYSDLQRDVDQLVSELFGPQLTCDASNLDSINQWGLSWFRAGAVIRNIDGQFLMSHEARVQVKKIKNPQLQQKYLDQGLKRNDWVDGDGGWNFPSGRLRIGESFEDGVIREIQEETGWKVMLVEPIHIRYSKKPDNMYIMPVYVAEALEGPEQYRTAETSEISWFFMDEIKAMHAAGSLRSPEFIMNALAAYEEFLQKTLQKTANV